MEGFDVATDKLIIEHTKNTHIISASTQSAVENTYEEYALLIGQNLEKYPEYTNKEQLQAICDNIGAEYIMLFDSNRDETMSNTRYVNLSLGKDASSATFDFRRLLTGTPLIRHEPALDEATGEEHVLIGVSYGAPEGKEGYQVLLLAVPKEKITAHTAESTTDIMTALVTEDMLAFSVDPETSLIVDASDSTLVGKNVLDLGLPERGLHSGYRDFFKLDGLSYYGECDEEDGLLYYYAARSTHIYQFVLPASLAVSVIAFLLLMILTLYFLFGYRKFFEKWSEIGEELMDSENVINMTRMNSWYPLEVSICLEDLDAVEKLLAEELPRIGEAIPEVISGPYYKGIVSMGKGTVTIAILAEYSESAFFRVQRSLNHSIHKLFEQNHIRIM